MSRISKYFLLLILLNFIFVSCTKAVDFSQADDLEITPTLESSLIFFNEAANGLLNSGNEITKIQDFIIVDLFNNEFIVDNLVKTDLIFETENTINRGFELQVDFFNELQQLQHTFTLRQDASINNNKIESSFVKVFEDATLDALKSTTIIVFKLRMLPGEQIDQNSSGRIDFKSKAVFYFNITTK
jgi:hypothetical protein